MTTNILPQEQQSHQLTPPRCPPTPFFLLPFPIRKREREREREKENREKEDEKDRDGVCNMYENFP